VINVHQRPQLRIKKLPFEAQGETGSEISGKRHPAGDAANSNSGRDAGRDWFFSGKQV
jgi:hypothetical protein